MTESNPVAELASMVDWARQNLQALCPDGLDDPMPFKERAVEAIQSFEKPQKQPFVSLQEVESFTLLNGLIGWGWTQFASVLIDVMVGSTWRRAFTWFK